ncbi:hypothetical protein GCM10011399_15830 [Subtercola lobariae]|uniref:Uncharacterized protein n=2 Tax=Subtercola lobariae TaxID=1588641 RepID=A0A917B4H3_9MICO|nr:hypothetical protein GCM10011399_15830 [Subtercola lobariae]
MFWYHTSTHANWPDRAFDPTAGFSDTTRQRFNEVGTDGRGLERWAERQKTKALHLGTYEAAVENMFRRITDQADSNDQFYLYRVRLTADAVIEPGVHPEPTNFVGDVQLAEISSPGADIFRYVNTHEDPSSVSLAVTVWAIQAVQGIAIPLDVDAADPWVKAATARLVVAASQPTPEPRTALERMRRRMPSVLSVEAGKLEEEIAETLLFWIRERFAADSDADALTTDPSLFSSKLLGLARLVSDSQAAHTALDAAPWRQL